MLTLSSHVLDTTLGCPAREMALTLTLPDGTRVSGHTDDDGRFKNWGVEDFTAGTYNLRFHTGEYLRQHHGSEFYPHVDVAFTMKADEGHHHIPLLISPFGFSSYRGS